MTTAKKTTAKKQSVEPSKTPKSTQKPMKSVEKEFAMPQEVKDWIDQASSRMMHMQTKISRLEADNKALRAANKVMEQRVMGMSVE